MLLQRGKAKVFSKQLPIALFLVDVPLISFVVKAYLKSRCKLVNLQRDVSKCMRARAAV